MQNRVLILITISLATIIIVSSVLIYRVFTFSDISAQDFSIEIKVLSETVIIDEQVQVQVTFTNHQRRRIRVFSCDCCEFVRWGIYHGWQIDSGAELCNLTLTTMFIRRRNQSFTFLRDASFFGIGEHQIAATTSFNPINYMDRETGDINRVITITSNVVNISVIART